MSSGNGKFERTGWSASFDTSDSFKHILGIIINNNDTTLQPHAQYDILWHK